MNDYKKTKRVGIDFMTSLILPQSAPVRNRSNTTKWWLDIFSRFQKWCDLPWCAVFCLNTGNFSMITMEGYRGRQIFCLFLTWLSYASTYLLRKPLGVVSLRVCTCFIYPIFVLFSKNP